MNPTTERVHCFIADFIEEHGYPPTIGEIAVGCALAEALVGEHLNTLEAAGNIVRRWGRPRGLWLAADPPSASRRQRRPRRKRQVGEQPSRPPVTHHTREVVYTFVGQYIQQHGYSPSIREIAWGTQLGKTAVLHHLRKLASTGRITFVPGRARTITLVAEGSLTEGTADTSRLAL